MVGRRFQDRMDELIERRYPTASTNKVDRTELKVLSVDLESAMSLKGLVIAFG